MSRSLRILLICQQDSGGQPHPVPAYRFWRGYFANALAEACHELVEVPGIDWAEGLLPLSTEARARWLGSAWSRTIDHLRIQSQKKQVDLVLCYLFPEQVDATAISAIQALGIPCVNFFCDNVREFTRTPDAYQPFALHWVPEAGARALYLKANLPFIYAPMPMWVPPEWRNPAAGESNETVFIGSHDELREELLGHAGALGLDIRIHGAGWSQPLAPGSPPVPRTMRRTLVNQLTFFRRHGLRGFIMRGTYRSRKKYPARWFADHAGPAVGHEDYMRLTRESRVVVGVNRYPSFRYSFSRPHSYSRLRDIEAPMLGACYLTEWAPGLEDLYNLGIEIETYRDASELEEKARSLAHDPKRRAELRRQGQRRALADHTIAHTLTRIVQRLGIE